MSTSFSSAFTVLSAVIARFSASFNFLFNNFSCTLKSSTRWFAWNQIDREVGQADNGQRSRHICITITFSSDTSRDLTIFCTMKSSSSRSTILLRRDFSSEISNFYGANANLKLGTRLYVRLAGLHSLFRSFQLLLDELQFPGYFVRLCVGVLGD